MPKDPTRSQAKFTRGKGSGTKVRKVTLKGKPKWKAAGVRSHLRQSDLDAAATDFARKFPSKAEAARRVKAFDSIAKDRPLTRDEKTTKSLAQKALRSKGIKFTPLRAKKK